MGVSTREKGVLKLVHPGRHVEVHREPITAAEIMSKYPRHCIARPDVFKFPYVVVRPESILLPGKVFYLVPNRTLYNLLKARDQRNQPSLQEKQSPQNHDHRGNTTGNAPIKCWGGINLKHHQHDRGRINPIHHQHDRGLRRRRLRSMLHDRANRHDQDSEDYQSDTSYVDAWTEISDKIRKTSYKSYQASLADSSFDSCRTFCGHNSTSTLPMVRSRYNVTSTSILPNVRNVSGDLGKLKSCFRKQDSQRKFLKLKVTFASPIIIPRSPGQLSSPEQTMRPCKRYNLRL